MDKNIVKYTRDVKELPIWLKYTLAITSLITFLAVVVFPLIHFAYGKEQRIKENLGIENTTDTIYYLPKIIDKAIALRRSIEQGDFIDKYVDAKIYGSGRIVSVSRAGDGFMSDIKVSGFILQHFLISCRLENIDEAEILLLQDKKVDFMGTFTNSNVFGGGLLIANCSITEH